jgi:hypothetical protein
MKEQRQHAGSEARRGPPKVSSGMKARGRHADRMQIALRPKTQMYQRVALRAREWGVSWNEAALRLIDSGLAAQ